MQVTTRYMRKAVAGWLREELATVEQATQLQSALEAGAIAGGLYDGQREGGKAEMNEVLDVQYSVHGGSYAPAYNDGPDGECGCLLDTLERIKNYRPVRKLVGSSVDTYALAQMIGYGDTPSTSPWARAAVRGINDYVATLEPA